MSTGPSASHASHSGSKSTSRIRKDASTWAQSSTGVITTLLNPLMVLAFCLLHLIYQFVVAAKELSSAFRHVTRRRTNRAPSSFTSLEDLLDAHACPSSAVRVPKHLAVVFADTVPSSIRLYISTLFSRLGRQKGLPRTDLWRGFRLQYEAAVEAKHVDDIATVNLLARISGVQQLSVYTTGLLSSQHCNN